jgi:hypothetical protein
MFKTGDSVFNTLTRQTGTIQAVNKTSVLGRDITWYQVGSTWYPETSLRLA